MRVILPPTMISRPSRAEGLECRVHSGLARLRIMFDALLSLAVIGSCMWYFLVGPVILQSSVPVASKLVESGYAIAGTAILLCVIPLWAGSRGETRHRAVTVLTIGLITAVGAETASEYCRFHHIHPGSFLHALGLGSGVLIGFAALLVRIADVKAREHAVPGADDTEASRQLWNRPVLVRALVPYAAVLVMGGLVARASSAGGAPSLIYGVYAGAALLMVCLFLRQIVSALEHAQLHRDVVAHADAARRLTDALLATQTELRVKQRDLQDKNRVLQSANQRLQALATSDALTGLANHRAMVGLLDAEIERAQRYGHTFAVVFIDLDHFKALNDSFGHPVGDAALREFASVVRAALRGPDILSRWGGEEFVALLPETSAEGAMEVIERARAAVADHAFTSAGTVHITCSCGVSIFPRDAVDRDGVITMADRAMYASKRQGRNQVRAASDPVVLALWAHEPEASASREGALGASVEALATLVERRDRSVPDHVDALASLTVLDGTELASNIPV